MQSFKRCTSCLQLKSVKDFYKDNKTVLRNYCISCWKNKCKNYNKINHKKNLVRTWYSRGIRYPDFNSLYKTYINTTNCYFCDITFNNEIKNKRRCLDHCDLSGSPRFIICSNCNVNILPKIDRLKNKLHLELHRYFLRLE